MCYTEEDWERRNYGEERKFLKGKTAKEIFDELSYRIAAHPIKTVEDLFYVYWPRTLEGNLILLGVTFLTNGFTLYIIFCIVGCVFLYWPIAAFIQHIMYWS